MSHESLQSELEKTEAINEQLSGAVTALRVELEQAKRERNAEGVRQRNIYLPQLQAHTAALVKARDALDRIWDIEEMGYTPDDPESESGHSTCNKCEAVMPHQEHAENCPQPIIEAAVAAINALLGERKK